MKSWVIRKSFARLVKARADESRERFVILSIVRGDLCKGRLVIAARMLIATPRIDPKTLSAGFVFGRRLAKCKVTFAPIDAQLDQHGWFHRRDEVVGKMEMARPRSHSVDARFEVARRQICVDNFRSHASKPE